MISKFFPIVVPEKLLSFWIYLIFEYCPKGTKWHSLVLQSRGLVEMIPSKKSMRTQLLGSTLWILDYQ